jgi:hypothetical protein
MMDATTLPNGTNDASLKHETGKLCSKKVTTAVATPFPTRKQ